MMKMDVNVSDRLHKEIYRMREQSLEVSDENAARILFRLLRITEEILDYIPKCGKRWDDEF